MSGEADRYRHAAGLIRSKAADVRATARAEAQALEEQAADLIRLASDLERDERGLPALPPAGL